MAVFRLYTASRELLNRWQAAEWPKQDYVSEPSRGLVNSKYSRIRGPGECFELYALTFSLHGTATDDLI